MALSTTGCNLLDFHINQTLFWCEFDNIACNSFSFNTTGCESVNSLGRIVELGPKLKEFTWVGSPEQQGEIDLSGIGLLNELKLLELSGHGSRLSLLPEDEVKELKVLQHLDLSGNNLLTLGEEYGLLQKLSYLDVRNNPLTSIDESLGTLSLTHLYLPEEPVALQCVFQRLWEYRQVVSGALTDWYPEDVHWCASYNGTYKPDTEEEDDREVAWQIIMISSLMFLLAVGAGFRAKQNGYFGGEHTLVISKGGPKDPAVYIIGERLRSSSRVIPSYMSSLRAATQSTELKTAAYHVNGTMLPRSSSSFSRKASRKESQKRLRFLSENPQFADIIEEDDGMEWDLGDFESGRHSRVSTVDLPAGLLEMPKGCQSIDLADPSPGSSTSWRTRVSRLSSIPRAMRVWGSWSDFGSSEP